MTEPIISIVIPCYNHGQYIDEAIKSVEEYKGRGYELIIINDGSTDDFTIKRMEELKANGYNVISQENQGLSRTRNNGIRIAKGKYILPLDADNMVKPEYISKGIEILNANPTISIVYSNRQFIGDLNHVLKIGEFDLPNVLDLNHVLKVGEFDISNALKGNVPDACAIYRKEVWNEIGGYDEALKGFEDWDFWLSAAEKGFRFFYIPETLFYYRYLENSMCRNIYKNPDLNNSLREYIYKKHVWLILKENERLSNELHNAKKRPFKAFRRHMKRNIINRYLEFANHLRQMSRKYP